MSEEENKESLTYAASGVDIEASEAATSALLGAVEKFDGDFAGLLDIGDRYLGLATDGVGTKLLVAEALRDYSTVGIDCIAMNVNDLVAAGVTPVGFVDYLAVDEPDDQVAEQIGEGLQVGAKHADIQLLGGETAIVPEIVKGLDLAGTCAGIAAKTDVFDGEAQVGDALVGWRSSGIHSNGLTLARTATTRDYGYTDSFPYDGYDTIGEALLEPTRIYTSLLPQLHDVETHAAAHITGGGWTNLSRMGKFEYVVTNPYPAPDVFRFVQETGNIGTEEMHRTFNMGTGFVAAMPRSDAKRVADATGGQIVGRVDNGSSVDVRGLSL